MEENKKTIPQIIKIRLLWLVVGLITSLLVSKYINNFEEMLEKYVLVAVFIPLIVYLADAIGTQMESIIIRNFVEEKKFDLSIFLKKQILIIIPIGIILSVVGYIGSFLMYRDLLVSLGLSLAIFASSLSSLLTGIIIPYMFWKLHEDPAEASGPLATVIQDSISVFIYFIIFSMILG